MAEHNKITYTKEYCKARKIPCKFKGEQMYVDGKYFIFSIYNIPWEEIVPLINRNVEYNSLGDFVRVKN